MNEQREPHVISIQMTVNAKSPYDFSQQFPVDVEKHWGGGRPFAHLFSLAQSLPYGSVVLCARQHFHDQEDKCAARVGAAKVGTTHETFLSALSGLRPGKSHMYGVTGRYSIMFQLRSSRR